LWTTCESCGDAVWTDTDRHDAVAKGEWVATNPDVGGVEGFHIPGLLSPWVALADIVQEFLMSKNDPTLLQVWTNTGLGEPFEPAQETVEGSSLWRRGENYGPQSIPDAVKLLTAGVDVQGDRIEVQILGFDAFEETWAVRYEVLPGDPAQRQVRDLLDNVLTESYRTDAARELRVREGHHQHQVLTYCRNRRSRGVLPIKGIAGPRPVWPIRASRTRSDARIFMVGVDTAKDVIYGRLRIQKPGPGYVHFPIGGAFDAEYFAQLTSEVVQTPIGKVGHIGCGCCRTAGATKAWTPRSTHWRHEVPLASGLIYCRDPCHRRSACRGLLAVLPPSPQHRLRRGRVIIRSPYLMRE
jgi:phage terminase large subunit GpA-like protein